MRSIRLMLVASIIATMSIVGGGTALAWHPSWSECEGVNSKATANYAGWDGTIKQGSTVIGTLTSQNQTVELPTLNVEYTYWASNGENPGSEDKFTPTKNCEQTYSPEYSANLTCNGLAVDLSGYKEGSTVKIILDGNVKKNGTFGTSYSNQWNIDPYKPHTASVTVDSNTNKGDWQWSDSDSACKTVVRVHKATVSWYGPCGDPMHGIIIRNKGDYTETFKFKFHKYHVGWTTRTIILAPHTSRWTGYKHVTGNTLMTVRWRGGTLLSQRMSGAPGNYKACVVPTK